MTFQHLSIALGNEVRALRERRGWTMAELGWRAGTAKSTISKIEAGLANPCLLTIRALAVAADLSPAEFMRRVETRAAALDS